MRTNRARVQKKRIVDLVALRNQLAVSLAGVTVKKTLVNRVVDHFDVIVGNGQQFMNFVLREL